MKMKYEVELTQEIKDRLNRYQVRLDIHGTKHRHVQPQEFTAAATAGAVIGGALGLAIPLPVVGNVIGAGVGAAVAMGAIGVTELNFARLNKKIDNATNVINFFKNDNVVDLTKHIIKDRWRIIKNVEDNDYNRKRLAKYLAANMISAIKYNIKHDFGVNEEAISDRLCEHLSSEPSHSIKKKNGDKISLKEIAKYKR